MSILVPCTNSSYSDDHRLEACEERLQTQSPRRGSRCGHARCDETIVVQHAGVLKWAGVSDAPTSGVAIPSVHGNHYWQLSALAFEQDSLRQRFAALAQTAVHSARLEQPCSMASTKKSASDYALRQWNLLQQCTGREAPRAQPCRRPDAVDTVNPGSTHLSFSACIAVFYVLSVVCVHPSSLSQSSHLSHSFLQRSLKHTVRLIRI